MNLHSYSKIKLFVPILIALATSPTTPPTQRGQSTANARIQLLFMRLHAMQATCNNDVYHNKSSSIKIQLKFME